MIKIIISVIIALSITGCYQSVNQNDIQRAEKACKDKGMSVVEILSDFAGMERAICSDGRTINI
jgi:outer membrane lipoprotein SlyB